MKRIRHRLQKLYYRLTRGPALDKESMAAVIQRDLLEQPINQGDQPVAILIPVRDAEAFLEPCMQALLELDYPHEKLRITFCEGDSHDGTFALLQTLAERHRAGFAEIRILHFPTGLAAPSVRAKRHAPTFQKARRAALAKVRNHLLHGGLDASDEWALWIDVDVCGYPRDILRQLLREQQKVIVPDCRVQSGGLSYDLNNFLEINEDKSYPYYKHVHKGLFIPPAGYERRRYLHQMRSEDRVPLSSVGATMLLVHGSVHRAGLNFPEIPYEDLLETEGFGKMCNDFGITPIGLPNLEILHVGW